LRDFVAGWRESVAPKRWRPSKTARRLNRFRIAMGGERVSLRVQEPDRCEPAETSLYQRLKRGGLTHVSLNDTFGL